MDYMLKLISAEGSNELLVATLCEQNDNRIAEFLRRTLYISSEYISIQRVHYAFKLAISYDPVTLFGTTRYPLLLLDQWKGESLMAKWVQLASQ